jgi:hypothetical protein
MFPDAEGQMAVGLAADTELERGAKTSSLRFAEG